MKMFILRNSTASAQAIPYSIQEMASSRANNTVFMKMPVHLAHEGGKKK